LQSPLEPFLQGAKALAIRSGSGHKDHVFTAGFHLNAVDFNLDVHVGRAVVAGTIRESGPAPLPVRPVVLRLQDTTGAVPSTLTDASLSARSPHPWTVTVTTMLLLQVPEEEMECWSRRACSRPVVVASSTSQPLSHDAAQCRSGFGW
jgi:hypothetical protein